MPPFPDCVPPCPVIAGDDNLGLRSVRHDGTCSLAGLLARKSSSSKEVVASFVCLPCCSTCVIHVGLYNRIASNRRPGHHFGILDVHKPLRQLRKRQVPVTNNFVGQRSRHALNKKASGSVFGNAPVRLLDQRPLNVVPIVVGLWVGAVERQITKSSGPGNQVLRVSAGLLPIHREGIVDNLCVCNQLNPHFSSFFCC